MQTHQGSNEAINAFRPHPENESHTMKSPTISFENSPPIVPGLDTQLSLNSALALDLPFDDGDIHDNSLLQDTQEAAPTASGEQSAGNLIMQLLVLLLLLLKKMTGGSDDSSELSPELNGDSPRSNFSAPSPAGDYGSPEAGDEPKIGGDSGEESYAPKPGSPGAKDGPTGLSSAAQTTKNSPAQSRATAVEYAQQLKKDFGLSDAQAAGIVGNLYHESGGMNSGMWQGGRMGEASMEGDVVNQTGYGIAQWGEERKQGLIDYASSHGLKTSSQAANYGFLRQELSGPYANVIADIKKADSPQKAAEIFANGYEQPSDRNYQPRYDYAQQVLSWMRQA